MKISHQATIIGTAIDITTRKETEKQLNDSRRELLALMNNIPGITFRCLYDEYWTMTFLSKAFSQVTGYWPEEVLWNKKISYQELIYSEDRDAVMESVASAVTKKEQYQIEYRIVCKSGEIRWVFEQGNAYIGKDHQIEFIEGIILDINDRKYAEEVQHVVGRIAGLSMEEVDFENHIYFEKVRELISTIMNAEHLSVLYYNNLAHDLKLLYSSDAIIKKDLDTVDAPEKTLTYKVISEQKSVFLTEEQIKNLDRKGKIIHYGKPAKQWIGIPMQLSGGNIGAVVLQSYSSENDYSEKELQALEIIAQHLVLAINRKDAVNALKERESYYRNLYMNLPESYHSMDEEGNLMVVNDKWLETLTYKWDEVLGRNFSEFLSRDMDFDFKEFLENFKRQGSVSDVQLKLQRKNKGIINVVYTGPVEYDQLGNFFKTHCVFTNVTQIKNAENTMRLAKEKAEENDKLKSAFLANMSHEIRSPMNAILGFADLLKDSSISNAKRERFTRLINERGNDLLRIIDDIIDISKLEAGSLKFFPETVRIYEFLENLEVSFKQEQARKKKEDISFVMDCGPELRDVSFSVDAVRLRQILMNLFSNALKFTDSGYVKLMVDKKANQVVFSVLDTGIGIPDDQKEMIFKRFHQVDMNFKSSRSGTSIGLAVSFNLARGMGGNLQVESTEGEGSTFTLSLPLKDMKKIRKSRKNSPKEETTRNQFSGEQNVLIVEDDYDSFLYLKNVIQPLNLNIQWAKNGDELFQTIREGFTPDLILMDIRLPGDINGLQLTQIIKKKFPAIIVIAQTAFAMQEDKKKARETGCDDFIAKPVSKKLLIVIVSKYLQNS